MADIAFIGGGNMSSCIFNGIVSTRKGQDRITVSGPHTDKLEHFKSAGAAVTADNVEAFNSADTVFFGVKPQVLPDVLAELVNSNVSFDGKLLISMAAGFTFKAFEKRIGKSTLIRIMPNTPSRLGLGVISVAAGENASAEDLEFCKELISPLGMIVNTDEEGINALGALAGSAPAFIFRFMEAFCAETVKRGFSEEEARRITEQTFFGSASLVKGSPDSSLAALREAVTSKGGTTFQGLRIMSEYRFEDMASDVIEACLKRTREFEDMFS